MDYDIYKMLHFTGMIILFSGLSGMAVSYFGGKNNFRKQLKFFGALHGIALLLLLISGFGFAGKNAIEFPLWMNIKILFWFILGGLPVLIKQKPQNIKMYFVIIIILGIAASYLGVVKPGF